MLNFRSEIPQLAKTWGGENLMTRKTTWTWPVSVVVLAACSGLALAAPGNNPLAAGFRHSLRLNSDGTVWAWGHNGWDQLGDGTTTSFRSTPVHVSGLSGVVAVAAGAEATHSLALKNDGTVCAWGDNGRGQLGDGTTTSRSTPVQVRVQVSGQSGLTGLSGVVAVAGGSAFNLVLRNDGTVWAWGANDWAQCGDGTHIDRSTPVQVSGLSGVAAVAAGGTHGLALKNDGTLWAWGYNGDGELGDGTTTSRIAPVQVSGLGGVVAVAAANAHSLAVKNDGTLWVWGSNGYGQLGDGTTTNRVTPVQVKPLSSVVAIAAGTAHSLAVKNDGTVWAWGDNGNGQLGDGIIAITRRNIPVQVSGLSAVVAVAAGTGHSLAVKNDGTVWAWGYNDDGELGDGTTTQRNTPVKTLPTGSATPLIADKGIVSASAFGQFSSVAPGSWIEIYGSNLAASSRSWTGGDFNGVNAPTSMDGAKMTIGGQLAFIDYISPTQINAQVPSNAPTGAQPVIVTTSAGASPAYTITVNQQQPGLLAPSSFIVGGKQYVVALFSDGATFVLPPGAIAGVPSRRAKAGDSITLYGVGFGSVTPNIPAGQVVQQTNTLTAQLHFLLGQTEAAVGYDGLAPNAVGLYQFNVVVPNVAASDTVPLTFTLGGVAGTQTLYIAVQ
jgi:uncharacterized protein (TIGR03437 family)